MSADIMYTQIVERSELLDSLRTEGEKQAQLTYGMIGPIAAAEYIDPGTIFDIYGSDALFAFNTSYNTTANKIKEQQS